MTPERTKSDAAKNNVLVLDGEQRSALAVTRSLVRAGFNVTVARSRKGAISALARGARSVTVNLDPLHSPQEYAAVIAQIAQRLNVSVVLPVTDASMEAVLEYRTLLPPDIAVPAPSHATYLRGSDKLRVHEAARKVGLAIEETAVIASRGDPLPSASDLLPGVVKPHKSVVGAENRTRTQVQLVRDEDECHKAIQALPPEAFPVLVQRRVIGDGVGYFAIRWQGRIIARFAHRRIREKPPSGGVSVLCESITPHPDLIQACDALLHELDWEGVAMVECKEDSERGGWKVMEINGRFWGSTQLAISSGIDFPAILVKAALGDVTTAPPQWRSGVRLRWEWGDVDHLLIRLRRSREHLSLPAKAPGKLGAVIAFLSFNPFRDKLEVFRLTDPLPFIGETLSRIGVLR